MNEVLESEHQRILALTLDRFPSETADAAGMRAAATAVVTEQRREAARLGTLSVDLNESASLALNSDDDTEEIEASPRHAIEEPSEEVAHGA